MWAGRGIPSGGRREEVFRRKRILNKIFVFEERRTHTGARFTKTVKKKEQKWRGGKNGEYQPSGEKEQEFKVS